MKFSTLYRGWRVLLLALGLYFSVQSSVWAHKASDAYLEFSANAAVSAQDLKTHTEAELFFINFSIALRDLDAGIDSLDVNNDRDLTWGEIRQNFPVIQSWVSDGIRLQCNSSNLDLVWDFDSLEKRPDGVYARLRTSARCDSASALVVSYQLMKNIDSTHRLLVGGTLQGKNLIAVVSPQIQHSVLVRGANSAQAFDKSQSPWLTFSQFFPVGIHHIATGYDHLAFLLSLLLPIVLFKRYQSAIQDPPTLTGLSALVRTVTGFTVGHSITLVMATLGWIGSPGWVEPAIAISIGISAWLNLHPVRWVRSDMLALGFGLIHGLGFSNMMREANVSTTLLPWALAGFNIGVEAGQLLGIAAWLGLQWILVRNRWYERVVVRGGSWALVVLASFWAIERTVNS